MNKSFVIGAAVGGAVALTAGAGAMVSHKWMHSAARYARVVQVVPLTHTVRTPRHVCRNETVQRTRPPRDRHQLIGSIAGAVIGGLLGNQIGEGSGRTLATVAGAAAGGYAGHSIESRVQRSDTYTATERHCSIRYERTVHTVGYRVRYRLDGKTGMVRMAHDPGQRIPVHDGHLVLAQPSVR